MPNTEKTLAKKLHELYDIQFEIEQLIEDAFEKYEPDVYDGIDFTIGSDYYDNSIEIYIQNVIPYPYEPSWEIRNVIYDMGFSIVYWNFKDKDGNYTEEIRGEEPRRFKRFKESKGKYATTFGHIHNQYGYVDDRFDEESWKPKYYKKKECLTQKIIKNTKSW